MKIKPISPNLTAWLKKLICQIGRKVVAHFTRLFNGRKGRMEMNRYFPQGIDGLLDGAVKAAVRSIEHTLEYTEFLVFVMSMGTRRLKLLFCADEMVAEEKAASEFKLETIPSLTDEEIKEAFYPLSPMDKAKFVVAVRKADGPVAIRFDALLGKMKSDERAAIAENKAEIAHRVQVEADKARLAEDEAAAKRVWTDDQALRYIALAPAGRFKAVADLDTVITVTDNGNMVFDWVNRRKIPVGDAMVLGLCLITDKRTAERLAEKFRRPKDKNRPLTFTIAATREWLAQCEKENEAARKREAEEVLAEKAGRDEFGTKVLGTFARALTLPDKELTRNQLKAECGGERWKLDIVRTEAETREEGIFTSFRQQLRERFPHSRSFPELDAFIKEMGARFIGRASAEAWPDNVVKGAERQVNIVRRHRQWLEDNPAGVRQPAQADVIDITDRWEHATSSSGRTREEELVRHGRQLLTTNWGRFSRLLPTSATKRGVKSAADCSDEELAAVSASHRKPGKKDAKAAKSGRR